MISLAACMFLSGAVMGWNLGFHAGRSGFAECYKNFEELHEAFLRMQQANSENQASAKEAQRLAHVCVDDTNAFLRRLGLK